jgi:prophage DNA circulation protein
LFTLKPLTDLHAPEAGLASWFMEKEKRMREDWNTWKAAAHDVQSAGGEGEGVLEIAMILLHPTFPCMTTFVEAFGNKLKI